MNVLRRLMTRTRDLSDRLGWLGCYMALYGAAVIAMSWLLLHRTIDWPMTTLAGALTLSVYLLDRVKPVDRLRDPADQLAYPARDVFVTRWRTPLRIICGIIVLAVAIAGLFVHWILPVATIGAIGGVLVYGSWPRSERMRSRPKDLLIIKNAAVAGAFAALALAMLWARGLQPTMVLPALGIMLFIAMHIFTDAMLCDIDDARADAQYGTSTIVNQINADGTWQLALLLNIIAAIWICIMASAKWIEPRPAIIIAMLLPLGTVIVRKISPNRVRDAVDLKLPLAVAAAIVLMRLAERA